MRRKEFIRNLAMFSGGLTLVSCGDDFVEGLVGDGEKEAISVEEANKWFHEQYLPKFQALRTSENNGKSYKRKAKWDKAKKNKDSRNQEFVWVPVEYETAAIPGVILMDEDTMWKQDLAEYVTEPVLEGLVVTKGKKNTEGYLVQVSYDPASVRRNGNKLELSKLDGNLLNSDWDDKPSELITFKGGKFVNRFGDESASGRIAGCYVIEVVYQTVEVQLTPIGTYIWVVRLHKRQRLSCTSGAPAGSSVGIGVSTNGGPYTGGGGNGDGTDIPDTYQSTLYPNYIVLDALTKNGSQRALLNARVAGFLSATSLSVSFVSFTLAKAEVLAKVLNAELQQFFPEAIVFGKRVAGLSLVIDGVLVYGVWSENGFNWNNLDDWEKVQTVVFGAAAAGFIFSSFWLAAAATTASIGLTVVKELL